MEPQLCIGATGPRIQRFRVSNNRSRSFNRRRRSGPTPPGARGEIVESVGGSPISPACLLGTILVPRSASSWIMLRIPRRFASDVVDVLPQLINVDVLPLAASAGSPMSGQRPTGILRDTSRESRKFPPGAQQIDAGRVHVLT
jgi:hypothetical protein